MIRYCKGQPSPTQYNSESDTDTASGSLQLTATFNNAINTPNNTSKPTESVSVHARQFLNIYRRADDCSSAVGSYSNNNKRSGWIWVKSGLYYLKKII